MKARIPLLVLSLLVVFVTVPAWAQASNEMSNIREPIDFIATACNGETVIISGEAHVIQHSVGTPGETGHSTVHIQFHLEGIGSGGTRYVANETVNSSEEVSVGAAQVMSSVGNLHLIAQGNADNLVVRTTIHMTTNANGEITSVSFEFESHCNG
jgi:hypothetical protein